VAVSGANGFVGSAVVRALAARGHEVVALVGPGPGAAELDALGVERRPLDLCDPASVRAGITGCDSLVHTAACYDFWLLDRSDFQRVNVDGTRLVLDAARAQGIAKLVFTSTAATLTESRELGPYKASKALAEQLVLREAARGLHAVVVQPTTVLGPGDRRPTPTGSLVVHFLNRRMKVYVAMAQNLVHVDDVALGHVLALEHGPAGERYLLGGDNLSMPELLAELSALTGIPAPRFALPNALLRGLGSANEWLSNHVTHRPPVLTREAALHARDSRPFDSSKAQKELGFTPRSARAVLLDAVRWFASEGFCPAATARAVLARPAFAVTQPIRSNPV
jgi:dihydroflavonol-4-reductase